MLQGKIAGSNDPVDAHLWCDAFTGQQQKKLFNRKRRDSDA